MGQVGQVAEINQVTRSHSSGASGTSGRNQPAVSECTNTPVRACWAIFYRFGAIVLHAFGVQVGSRVWK